MISRFSELCESIPVRRWIHSLRIISWNIRAGGGYRAERIAEQLCRWQPTVVVLSEFRATPPSCEIAARLFTAGLIHQKSTASVDAHATNALLIASRLPLQTLPGSFVPYEPFRWLAVRVGGLHPFSLGALHTPNKVSGRKYVFHDAVVSVAKRWQRRPALIIGDTNSGLPGIDEEVPCFGVGEQAFFESLANAGWTDSFRHLRGQTRAYTWYSPNAGNGFRLDQGFVSKALVPCLSQVTYTWPGGRQGRRESGRDRGRENGMSDHAALLIDLVDTPT